MPTIAAKDLDLEQKRYLTSCYGFCKELLGMELYDDVEGKGSDWQMRVMNALDKHGARVSACTANGVGKTSKVVTGAILWHMAIFPWSLAVSTAGAFRQVKHQLFPNLMDYAWKFPTWKFKPGSLEIVGDHGARYIGFSTDDEGKAEGFHGNKHEAYAIEPGDSVNRTERDVIEAIKFHADKGPLLVILDEAKTVPDGIKEAIERCTYQRLLLTSSTGFAEGFFWESHTKKSKFYHTFKIPQKGTFTEKPAGETEPTSLGYQENRHVDFQKAAKLREERGPQDPLVRSTQDAEFMDDVEGAIISYRATERLMQQPPDRKPGIRCAYCDFAAGGDENVFALREGNDIQLIKCWREKDTTKAAAEFVMLFQQHQLTPEWIGGDNDGLGRAMIDLIHRMGWPIRRIYGGEAPHRRKEYMNRMSEVWFEGAKAISLREYRLPEDDDLKIQLCQRKGKTNAKMKLQAEPKKDMISRGLNSPDRADAVLNVMAWDYVNQPQAYNDLDEYERPDIFIDDDGHVRMASEVIPGIDAGL